MAFNLGPTDFQSFRDETTSYQKFIDAQNKRNAARGAGLTLPPVVELPDNRPHNLPVTQRGPTPEEVAAKQAQAAELQKVLDAQAAQRTAAQAKPKPAPLTAGLTPPDPDSFASRGIVPRTAGPGKIGEDRVGRASERGVAQLNPATDAPVEALVKGSAAEIQFNLKMKRLRYGPSIFGVDGGVSTGVFGQLAGQFQGPEKRKEREELGRIVDWYDTDEAEAYFRANPQHLDFALRDRVGFFNNLQATALPADGVGGFDIAGRISADDPFPAQPPQPAAPAAAAPAVAPVRLQAAIKAIALLESSGGKNLKNKKGTSSGVMGVLDSTALDPGIPGLAPALSTSDEHKDDFGRRYLAHLMAQYPNDMSRVAIAYTLGIGTAAKWDGTIDDAVALAKGKRTRKDIVNYLLTFNNAVAAAAPATPVAPQQAVASAAPTVPAAPAAPTAAAGVPEIVAAEAAATKVIDKDSIGRPLTVKKEAGVSETPKTTAEELLVKPPEKVKEPPQKMSFVLRSSEIRTTIDQLNTLRERAKFLARAGAYEELFGAVAAVNSHTVAVKNMIAKQALNSFEASGNPRMLNKVLSEENNRDIVIAPNSDGTWNVSVDGAPTIESITAKAILKQQTNQWSQVWFDQMKAVLTKTKSEIMMEQIKAAFALNLEVTKQHGELMRERLKAMKFGKDEATGEALYNDGSGGIFKLGQIPGTHGKDVYAMVPVLRVGANAGTPKAHKRSN